MKAPSVADAKAWAEHFGMETSREEFVLAGTREYIGKHTYNLIPGFQLIDKQFFLRSDSTGHRPKDSLYSTLIPMIPELLNS